MSTSTPGPGITWLAHHSDTPADELLGDHRALVAALTASGRDSAGERFGSRVADILRDAAQRLREAPPA
jgi:hypothetical protein